MAAQFLTISKLSNIISMITLGEQSGILRVIRGQGSGRELGQIKFVNGTPVSALLGQLTGNNAMSVLSNWGECVYSFEEQISSDGEGSSDRFGGVPGSSGYGFNSGPLASGSWPAYGFPSSAPLTPPATTSQTPTTNPLQGSTVSRPAYRPTQQSGFPPGYGQGPSGMPQSGELSGMSDPYSQPRGAPPVGGPGDPFGPRIQLLVPRRTMLSEHIDQLPLDRRERMVLLLVDGQRTLSDLARLTRRTERELLTVLDYLSGLGLVILQG